MTREGTKAAAKFSSASIALMGVLASPLACDGQVTPEYHGEPVAVIHGTVRNPFRDFVPPPSDAILVWLRFDGSHFTNFDVARAPVRGDFPASFELRLYSTPPASILSRVVDADNEPLFTMGALELIQDGAPIAPVMQLTGFSPQDSIVYFDRDVAAGSRTAIELHTPALRAGYHILRIRHASPTEAQIEACATGLRDVFHCTPDQASNTCSHMATVGDAQEEWLDVNDADSEIELRVATPHSDPCEPQPDDDPQPTIDADAGVDAAARQNP